MVGRENDVIDALERPDEIRVSKRGEAGYFFFKSERLNCWVCAVARQLNGDGFLITAYPTQAMKEGIRIWPM